MILSLIVASVLSVLLVSPVFPQLQSQGGVAPRRQSLDFGGIQRTYHIYVPKSYDGSKAVPLVFLLHGGGGNGKRMFRFTGFDQIADREGFIIVCPDGLERHWNDGRLGTGYKAHEGKVDDVGFISKLIDIISSQFKIDQERVYASGISNGGMMSFRLGIELTDRLAAIAPVVACLPEALSTEKAKGPLPVMVINGTADPLVPFDGGEVGFGKRKLGKVISCEQTIQYWRNTNGLKAKPRLSDLPLSKSAGDDMPVKKTVYSDGSGEAEVVLITVVGGGHSWPGQNTFVQYLPENMIGKACNSFNASELIWDFFKNKKRRI